MQVHDDRKQVFVKTEVLKKRCKYHKRAGEKYDMDSLGPPGLCLDAYHVAYPYCLALLYDAEFTKSDERYHHTDSQRDRVLVQCPNPKERVVMEIRRYYVLPKAVKSLKNLAERILEKLSFPVDVIEYRIGIMVVEVKGNCPHSHKVGEKFWFNIRTRLFWLNGRQEEICPASFDQLYPFIALARRGVKIPWSNNGSSACLNCPDDKGVVYKIYSGE